MVLAVSAPALNVSVVRDPSAVIEEAAIAAKLLVSEASSTYPSSELTEPHDTVAEVTYTWSMVGLIGAAPAVVRVDPTNT